MYIWTHGVTWDLKKYECVSCAYLYCCNVIIVQCIHVTTLICQVFGNVDFIIISLHMRQCINVTVMGKIDFYLTKTNNNTPRIVCTMSGISYKYGYRTQFNTLGPKLLPNLTDMHHVYSNFPEDLTHLTPYFVPAMFSCDQPIWTDDSSVMRCDGWMSAVRLWCQEVSLPFQ